MQIEKEVSDEKTHQGNSLSILLLVIPIGMLIWVFRTKAVIPLDQVGFFKTSLIYTISAFVLLWILSFRKTIKSPSLYGVTAFLLLLWVISGVVGVAKINMSWDSSTEKTYYMKAIEARKMSSSSRAPFSGGGSYCSVRFEKEMLNTDWVSVKYDECDFIVAGQDGLEMKVKDGTLGMPWMTDHSIVKDYDLYKSRLGITDGLNQ